MNENQLKWTTLDKRLLLHTPVYDVLEQRERAASGLEGSYIAIQAPDWVMTVPVLNGNFLLVRQWRHSAEALSLEFPGGVADPGEDPARTAARELEEETGYRAKQLTFLGSVNPNPALFKNRFYCYLAEELEPTGAQHLDADEILRCEQRPVEEVIAEFGSPEYSHALMGAALAFYLRHRAGNGGAAG